MVRKRSEQAARTRAHIIATAEYLFASRGYDATSLQTIADAAGVGKANVYYYFKSKVDILDAALVSATASIGELLAGARSVPPGPARVRFLLDGYVELLVVRRGRFPSVLGEAAIWRERTARGVLQRLVDRTTALVFDSPLTVSQRVLVNQLLALQQSVPGMSKLTDDEMRIVLHQVIDALLTVDGAPAAEPWA